MHHITSALLFDAGIITQHPMRGDKLLIYDVKCRHDAARHWIRGMQPLQTNVPSVPSTCCWWQLTSLYIDRDLRGKPQLHDYVSHCAQSRTREVNLEAIWRGTGSIVAACPVVYASAAM